MFSLLLFYLFSNTDSSVHNALFLSADATFSPGMGDKLIILQTDKEKPSPLSLPLCFCFIHLVSPVFICIRYLVLIDYLYSSKEKWYQTYTT